jgi:hypothetical protein
MTVAQDVAQDLRVCAGVNLPGRMAMAKDMTTVEANAGSSGVLLQEIVN